MSVLYAAGRLKLLCTTLAPLPFCFSLTRVYFLSLNFIEGLGEVTFCKGSTFSSSCWVNLLSFVWFKVYSEFFLIINFWESLGPPIFAACLRPFMVDDLGGTEVDPWGRLNASPWISFNLWGAFLVKLLLEEEGWIWAAGSFWFLKKRGYLSLVDPLFGVLVLSVPGSPLGLRIWFEF